MKFNRREMLTLGGAGLVGMALGPKRAFGSCGSVSGAIEVFPTSPLILNPFTDKLPIPAPLAPVSHADLLAGTPYPHPGKNNQDCDGGVHQYWTGEALPDDSIVQEPVYYRINLRVREHHFTKQLVQPIALDPATGLIAPGPLGTGPQPLPGSTIYGFNGTFPGPMIYARYGQPCCVRFVNQLDGIGDPDPHNYLDRGDFGAEDWAFLTHLHNGHTACESDGQPHYKSGAYQPGDWCDNLYLNYPAGGDDSEKQSFMWFHDHRMDHTGANVYKGMVGLFPIYDPDSNKDNGNELKGYRLPGVPSTDGSGRIDYDIPLAFYDCRLDDGVTQHQDFHNGCGETHPLWWGKTFFRHFPNHGFVGDVFTVNGVAYPTLEVKRRRYRFRLLDASIARIYELKLMSSSTPPVASKDTGRTGKKLQGQYQLPNGQQCMKMVQVAAEGGLLQFPFLRNSIEIWPAKRREIIVDFAHYQDGSITSIGDEIYLVNVLQMTTGRKPNHATITHDPETGLPLPTPIPDPDFDSDFRVPVLKFKIVGPDVPDNSKDPFDYVNKDSNGTCTLKLDSGGLPILSMRAQPKMPVARSTSDRKGFSFFTAELQRGGGVGEVQWKINGFPFDPLVPLTSVTKGQEGFWTIRNGGGGWVHPLHIHEEEHRVISRNGVPTPSNAKDPTLYNQTYNGHDHPDDLGKEDVVALDPGEEVVVFRRWRSFTGPYVCHCHNLAHEDHAMMFGWSILPPV